MLVLTGLIPAWGDWYMPISYERAQTEALLRGDLALSTDPGNLTHDLCWSGGGVQQVWGLGVPLWHLPFSLAGNWLGHSAFPERVAFGILLTVAAYVACCRVLGIRWKGVGGGDGPSIISFSFACGGLVLLLFFPAFVSLLGCRGAIYENVLAYVYLYGIFLICGILWLIERPSSVRFWVLCGLAGFGALIRPTLIFYGFASVVTGGLILVLARNREETEGYRNPFGLRTLRHLGIWVGLGLFLAGGTALWLTNAARFGDGFEFGHRLNLQRGSLLGSIYATRFGHPFSQEPIVSAAKELFGALFLVDKLNGGDWYAGGIFAGQSSTIRWREFYFTTYDASHVPLIIAGWFVGAANGRRFVRKQAWMRKGRLDFPVAAGLSIWSLLAFLPLAAFYSWTPALSSRYMIDFAPAFASAILAAWFGLMKSIGRMKKRRSSAAGLSLAALVGWTIAEVATANNAYGAPRSVDWTMASTRREAPARKSMELPSFYEGEQDLAEFGVPYNGAGWNDDGSLEVAVILFVESPRFLELDLEEMRETGGVAAADPENVRAKVGLEFLARESIHRTETGWRVRFHGPKKHCYREGLQPVFIATVRPEHLADSATAWRLTRVSWRSESSG